jgi:negative regulator of sigma E activity
MAFDEKHGQSLDEASCLVVAALADGEPVDPDALRAALSDAAVRDYLIDLVALRGAVRTANDLPAVRWRERKSVRSQVAWLSVAAAVVVSLTAGYAAGQRTVQAPPAPMVETVVHLESPVTAPKPTRVISLRPGVNWTERVGEQ